MTSEAIPKRVIQEALEDGDGNKFLIFGQGDKRCCIPLIELHSFDKDLLGRLERAGVSLVTPAAEKALKQEAQSLTSFRKVSIATSPGWAGGAFASPEGSTIGSPIGGEEVIMAFEADPRFAASSELVAWQDAITPFVRHQPLPLFAAAFSLIGPLLRYAPADMQNPVIEFVGAKEQGKSTLAKLMSSVWGGDPEASLGICMDWDFSPAEIDNMRASRRDGLLILDEVNHASKDEGEKAKIVEKTIFRLADTASRKRFGEPSKKPIRQASVSTSNIPIRELATMPAASKEAMLSRILSIQCARPFGIFDTVPSGYSEAGSAVRAMNAAVTEHYGSAASAFIARLLGHPPKLVQAAIVKGMNEAVSQGLTADIEGARLAKTVAIAYTAGRIARQLGILPKSWGRIDCAFAAIFVASPTIPRHEEVDVVPASAMSPARRAIAAYLERYRSDMLLPTDGDLPLSQIDFEQLPGVWLKRGEVFVASTRFVEENLPNSKMILRQARDEGGLDCERGQLTKKAPRTIAKGGRAHFIRVSVSA